MNNEEKIICELCRGSGTYSLRDDLDGECPRCHGEGKLDWVENVVGKQSSFPKNPIVGTVFYNKEDQRMYGWDGNTWQRMILTRNY